MSKFKIALILLQFADLMTTLYVFHIGGYEANPIVAHVPALGPSPGLIVAKVIALVIVYRLQSPRILGFAVA